MSLLRSLSVFVLVLALGGGVLLHLTRGAAVPPPPAPEPARPSQAGPPTAPAPLDPNAAQVGPGDPRWKRFALVVGLNRLAQHPTLAPDAAQAGVLADRLEALRRADGVNDFLFTRLLQVLTPEQIRYMADNVQRPRGACTCPCSTWDPLLVGATKLLEKRSEGPPADLEMPADLEAEPEGPDLEEALDAPETLILLQGVTRVERLEKLRLTPEQSRQLLPVVEKMAVTLADIEKQMHGLEDALSPEQAAFIETEGSAWFPPDATAADMNERWEEWLEEAIDEMHRLEDGR